MTVEHSADGGTQVLHNGGGVLEHYNNSVFEYEVYVNETATYFLVANFTTWHINQDLLARVNSEDSDEKVGLFYTYGRWQETQPLEVQLVKGKNVLRFARISDRPVVIREFFLYKTEPLIPTQDPSILP